MDFLLKGEDSSTIQVQKDPFRKNCIERVSIIFRKTLFTDSPVWDGNICFKNGQTKGEQDFTVNGEDGFQELVNQVQNFIKSLP